MRPIGTRGIACRMAGAACVAVVAVAGTPAIGSGQAARGQTELNQLDVRDMGLEFEATTDTEVAPTIETGVAPTVPRGYALVIGVGEYPNLPEPLQLDFAESDARAMYRVLISQEGGAFPPENVRMLVGEQASLANIRRELEEWLPSVARPADRVVVYFAGHGFVGEDGRGYLAPSDVDRGRLAGTGYPMAALGDVMANRVRARWKVLFTDACRSGKINAETTNEALHRELGNLPPDFLTLTAATARERAYSDPELATGFGLFTYFLTNAFRGYADLDPRDGLITAHELIEYVRRGVVGYARDRSVFQTPTERGDYDPEMLLGVRTEDLIAVGPDLVFGAAVVEANLDDVALYIGGQFVGPVSRGEPLRVTGLPVGVHEFEGVRTGYEPDTKEVLIRPGQEVAVTLRIRYPRQVGPEARRLFEQGERLLYTRRSPVSLWNLLPVTRTQSRADLERARDLFIAALRLDSDYIEAARELGHVHHLLGEREAALDAYEKAIEIERTNIETLIQQAAVWMEYGDPRAAVEILEDAKSLVEPSDTLHGMLARAHWESLAWEQAVTEARQAIALNPESQQAHLWKADALRMLAAGETPGGARAALFGEARDDYRTFLDLTTFESSFGRRLLFFVGVAARVHADREEAYRRSRSTGYLGLCVVERALGNPRRARGYCERAIDYREDNVVAHFVFANANRDLFNDVEQTCDYLTAAARGYRRVTELGPSHEVAGNARYYLERIAALMPRAGCSGA